MILQWTSSVNNLTLPTGGLAPSDFMTTYDYEDVMKHHVWNLYTNLVENGGWVPVSASYSSSIGYNLTSSGWPTKNNLSFPDEMTTTSLDDIQNLLSVTYQPTDHCWVTLKKTFNSSNYFMTLDCRYPLPPHKSNSNIVYNKLKDTTVDPPIISYEEQLRSNTKKVFIGPSSIIYDKTLTNFEGKPDQAWINKQETNMFNGIAFRDNINTVFDMTPAVISTGQDYISRCVGFIDISFNQGNNDSIAYHNGSTYKSATTKVRPKNGKDDTNSWYVCWGFDFIDIPGNSAKTKISLEDYKYAFHYAPTGEFIYQIYKLGDSTFRSGIGLLPISNKNTQDPVDHTSFCVNCDPSTVFNTNKINFNTAGSVISIIQDNNLEVFKTKIAATGSTDGDQNWLNSYFNTCYRNYSFSDGINLISAGDGGIIGTISNLNIFAPTKPRDASLYSSPKTATTASFGNLMSTAVNVYLENDWTGDNDVNPITLPYVGRTNPINNTMRKKYERQVKISVPVTPTGTYPVFCMINTSGNSLGISRKLVLADTGVLRLPFSEVAYADATKRLTLENKAIFKDQPADAYRDCFKDIFFTAETFKKDVTLNLTQFLTKIDNNMFVDIATGKVIIYVGDRALKIPANNSFKDLNPRPDRVSYPTSVGTWRLTDNMVSSINTMLGVTTTTDQMVEYLAFNAKTTSLATAVSTFATAPCYIEVPIAHIYNYINGIQNEGGETFSHIGNFNYLNPSNTVRKSQDKGINFFSVFKSSFYGLQQPLAGCVYSFAENRTDMSEKSVFGVVNKDDSSTDKLFLVQKDKFNSYSELPIFLTSLTQDYPELKGYVPDIYWAPGNVTECAVVSSGGEVSKLYKKVYWNGCWFPWVSDNPPEI